MSKALVLAALLLAAAVCASADRTLKQGYFYSGTDARSHVSSVPGGLKVDPWTGPSVTYPNSTAKVGETITFVWPAGQNHGVYIIPTDTCPSTFQNGQNGQVAIKEGVEGPATATYTFTKAGTYWFACPVDDHCSTGGMKLKVTVS